MGHVFAELELSNPRRTDFVPVRVNALVDTGALMLCIPEHVARQLDLQTESVREVSVADGRTATAPYVGPVKVAFGKRFCYVGALVIGDEVLLGSVPMEDMDLVVNPGRRELTVDPASPNVPHARVKSAKDAVRGERKAPRERVSQLRPAIPMIVDEAVELTDSQFATAIPAVFADASFGADSSRVPTWWRCAGLSDLRKSNLLQRSVSAFTPCAIGNRAAAVLKDRRWRSCESPRGIRKSYVRTSNR